MAPCTFFAGATPSTAVVYAWCGVDACLLQPCNLMPVESWTYMLPDLERLADQMCPASRVKLIASPQTKPLWHSLSLWKPWTLRMEACRRGGRGQEQSFRFAAPVYHSTDTYIKYGASVQPVSKTARGDATSVTPGLCECPTTRLGTSFLSV